MAFKVLKFNLKVSHYSFCSRFTTLTSTLISIEQEDDLLVTSSDVLI